MRSYIHYVKASTRRPAFSSSILFDGRRYSVSVQLNGKKECATDKVGSILLMCFRTRVVESFIKTDTCTHDPSCEYYHLLVWAISREIR